jgi:hypothetical protein
LASTKNENHNLPTNPLFAGYLHEGTTFSYDEAVFNQQVAVRLGEFQLPRQLCSRLMLAGWFQSLAELFAWRATSFPDNSIQFCASIS